MTSLAYDDTKAGDLFASRIQAIYESFSRLSRADIAQFKRWYQGNNDLEKVCANDSSIHLVHYTDIPVVHKGLKEQLAEFFKDLYSQSLLSLAALRAKIGDIDDHYDTFMQINNGRWSNAA